MSADGLGTRAFSEAEMSERLRRVCGLLPRDLDAVLLHSADSVLYVSGVPLLSEWGRPMWCVFRLDGSGTSIGAAIELENMQENSVFDDVRTYADDRNVWEASIGIVRAALGGAPIRRLGVERALLTLGVAEALQETFPAAELVDVGSRLAEARLVKSAEEIGILRLGGQIAKIGAAAFLEAQREGASELAVSSHAVAEMERALAALAPDLLSSSYAYCQSGPRSLTPHLHATGHRLRRGDVVALNVFPVLSGYCMELERTCVLGEPSRRHAEVLDAVAEAFDAAKELLAPGVAMCDVDALASRILRERGFGEYIRHGTGHAHGIMVGSAAREELGELRGYNRRRLAPGMACSVEPGVYIPGLGGFRHSDVMLITETGADCLTSFPRQLSAALTL